jgi:MFS family permease
MAHARSQTATVVAFGFGQMVAFASSFYLVGVLGDGITRDLRLGPNLVFALASLSLAVTAFAAPAVARRMDARGGRGALLASSPVFAAGLALLGLAPGPLGLAAGMTVVGAGMALGLSPTPFAILVHLYGEGARRPITGVALLGGLGSSVGWPLTAWFEAHLGWRGACFAWAALHLAVCLPLQAWAAPKGPPPAHDHAAAGAPAMRWDRAMLQMAVLFACAWLVSTCISAHLPRLLQAYGLAAPRAAATASLLGVAAVSVRFLEFTVLRKVDPLVTTRIATLMHPAGALGLLLAGAAAAPGMALGQGAGNGMLTVAKGVLPLKLYGPAGYAYRSALLSRPAQFAQIAGPLVYGLALHRSAALALALSSGLCLIMFAMTFGLAPRGAACGSAAAPA